jgi:hypothetical protein
VCGDLRVDHTAKTLLRNDACAYAHDPDNPCWCYGFMPMYNPDGTLMNFISHGKLNDEQEAVLRRFVMGYNVHDIGAGQLALAKKLQELGAHTVTAIDKMYSHHMVFTPHPSITLVGEYFEEYARHGHFIDVAFVSWPEVHGQRRIVDLLRGARTIIYLGSNFDGTACGSVEMFQYLSQREVLALVPAKWNSLIVYGHTYPIQRRLLPEEYAAIHRANEYFEWGADIAM